VTCLSPIDVRRPDWAIERRYIAVPCGRCVGCRLERRRNWTIRIMHEARYHDANCMLTLTLDDDNLVYGRLQPTLVKRDLQLFWKRLRKEIKVDVRYFACGEYGSAGSRPHYHAILFGFDFPDKVIKFRDNGHDIFVSDTLDSIWGKGVCSIGALTAASAAYVAGYIMDKSLGSESRKYEYLGIEPEFVVMSRKPGIGRKFFEEFSSDIFPGDFVMMEDGRRSKPPRYYDELMKSQNPKVMETIKLHRMMEAEKNFSHAEAGAKRMLSKIRFHENRVKSLKKSLH